MGVRLLTSHNELRPSSDSSATVGEVAAAARLELSGRVLAVTLRSVRDLDIAEEATADAFLLALQAWPDRGVPASVEAWLITTARRRAVDRIRQARAARRALVRLRGGAQGTSPPADLSAETGVVGDEELRLVVLCCDPRISDQDQVALTLRLACGVPSDAIAAAFLVSRATMAARLTRAKHRLAAAGPNLDLPDDATVDARLPVVRRVVHLAFTLGHTAGAGAALTDEPLADRAQYLARALHRLRPQDREFAGLLALILLTRARSPGRVDDAGTQVLLLDADRGRWDRAMLREGLALVRPLADLPGPAASPGPAMSPGPAAPPGPMVLQAAIAAEHAVAAGAADTDWERLIRLYGALLRAEPAPTIAIGRSIALSHARGAAAGLTDLDEVLALGLLDAYPYAYGARAQLLGRLGRHAEAAEAWTRAAGLARTDAERDYFAAAARVAVTTEPGSEHTEGP